MKGKNSIDLTDDIIDKFQCCQTVITARVSFSNRSHGYLIVRIWGTGVYKFYTSPSSLLQIKQLEFQISQSYNQPNLLPKECEKQKLWKIF
jgi:hypothetical protein